MTFELRAYCHGENNDPKLNFTIPKNESKLFQNRTLKYRIKITSLKQL